MQMRNNFSLRMGPFRHFEFNKSEGDGYYFNRKFKGRYMRYCAIAATLNMCLNLRKLNYVVIEFLYIDFRFSATSALGRKLVCIVSSSHNFSFDKLV